MSVGMREEQKEYEYGTRTGACGGGGIPGEMSTTDKEREPEEGEEEGKDGKCQRESVYLDFTRGRRM